MALDVPLPIQTMYAELVERAHVGQMAADFDPAGTFVSKSSHGAVFWYYRSPMRDGKRSDHYVGRDSDDLRRRIAEHRAQKDGYKQRRALVTGLLRTGLRGPDPRTGRILEALANAGAFRMRAVIVGTAAYQTYSGLLGKKLSNTNAMTDDLDIAQFKTVSIAIEDAMAVPLLDTLRSVEPDFRPLDETFAPGRSTHYAIGDEYRVDVLTPNRGPDDDAPVKLPAIRSDAQPLRFLDFLIYQEVQAVALYGQGVPLNVPAPERYALHKLLVSRMRINTPQSQAKARKDLRQAGELLIVLAEQRPYELRDLWEEMIGRGPKWRRKAEEAVGLLDAEMRSSEARLRFEEVVGKVTTTTHT